MLANSSKDNPLSSTESCALYYFPEIPCSKEEERVAASTKGQFVSGAHTRNDDHASKSAQPQDSEQIQCLIGEAFKKGMDQGRAEAVAAQQENVDQARVALKAAVQELARVRQNEIERIETETVRLALAIAKKIIGNETAHGSVIGHVVKTAMTKVADPRQLILRLNPKDIDTVNGFKQELLLADDFGSVLRLEADETIQRSGCMIETKLGDVDARIDQQIKIIEELLSAQLPKHSHEG